MYAWLKSPGFLVYRVVANTFTLWGDYGLPTWLVCYVAVKRFCVSVGMILWRNGKGSWWQYVRGMMWMLNWIFDYSKTSHVFCYSVEYLSYSSQYMHWHVFVVHASVSLTMVYVQIHIYCLREKSCSIVVMFRWGTFLVCPVKAIVILLTALTAYFIALRFFA